MRTPLRPNGRSPLVSEVRAAVVTSYGQPLEIRHVRVPEVEDGGALMRVEAATLCGTDVHFWRAAESVNATLPYIPGHETTGTLVEVNGERFDILGRRLQPGDRVLAAYAFCGHCFYCTIARQPTLCRHSIRFGRQPVTQPPYLLGGCAEMHYLPPACEIISVPDAVPPALAASAACALRTVMHGFERLGPIASHETVLVQGAGPVGLYAAAVARDRGARQVLVIGATVNRLSVATAWGATDVLDLDVTPDEEDRREWVMDHTDGRGADVVFQCATLAAVPEGLALTRAGGRFVSIGGGGAKDLRIPAAAWGRLIDIKSVVAAEGRHFFQALEFLATRQQRIPFDRLISGSYRLDQTTEALTAMSELREVKPVILPAITL
jgi:threonine dehydrogenase-like Zn-dependent dehydrogenase